MKVIVVSVVGFGGSYTHAYKYSKQKYIKMVEDEFAFCKEEKGVENEYDVKEWIEESKDNKGQPGEVSIITPDYGYHYTVCEVA